MERWSKKLEVKRNGLSNSITMLRVPLKGRGPFAKSPLLPSTKNILKKKTKGPSMKASWPIIFFYWNGKWPWQCSGLHNALKGITMAKMQTWQKIPTLPVVLMILKTLLQMNAAGEKVLTLPNHRKFPSRTTSDVSGTLIPNAEIQSIKVTNNLLKWTLECNCQFIQQNWTVIAWIFSPISYNYIKPAKKQNAAQPFMTLVSWLPWV